MNISPSWHDPKVSHETNTLKLFKALGDRNRLRIILILLDGPKTLQKLSKQLHMSPSATMHHVKILSQYGYVAHSQEFDESGEPQRLLSLTDQMPYVDFPQRKYQQLAEGLATYLRPVLGDEAFGEALSKMGESMGIEAAMDLQVQSQNTRWTLRTFVDTFILKYLASTGEQPVVISQNDSTVVYQVRNCPYREVAFNHPNVYCDSLESGFYRGLGNTIGTLTVRRTKCGPRGDSCCEFAIVSK